MVMESAARTPISMPGRASPWNSSPSSLVLALLQYIVFAMLVGSARGKYGVKAPAVTGHETFERYFRVQHEHASSCWWPSARPSGCSRHYVSTLWAAILGGVYLVGRFVYLRSRTWRIRTKRSAGFGLSMLPILAMLIGALIKARVAALA